MGKLNQSGRLHFLPVRTGQQFVSNAGPDSESTAASTTASNANLVASLSLEWQPIAWHILHTISAMPAGQSVAVCVDDLLAMQLYSTNKDARRFLSAMDSLLASRQIDTLVVYGKAYADAQCSMMQTQPYTQAPCGSSGQHGAVVNTFCSNPGTDEIPLYAYCSYRATVSVIVSPLSTGYAMDIHGQILIHSRNSATDTVVSFKALDSGISCAIIKE
jgi:hypothetical protein